jgi:iron(III) transport system substrate-binding protein
MNRLVCAAIALLLIVSCSGKPAEDANEVVVYSGRNESLIGPLLDRFTEKTGIRVRVRYGGTAELAATLMEEGDRTPAGLFVSQDAAALGALSDLGMLRPVPSQTLARLPARFRSPNGDWVGLSGRARVVVFNSELISEEDLPRSLTDIADPRYRGRFGVAPTNASFQAHMALYLARNGEAALGRLLEGMAANEPLPFSKNSPIVEAVIAGEIEWGLVNHYYLWRALKENPTAPARNFFMRGDDVSSFVNLAGAALLNDDPAAAELLEYLLTDEAQRYFADETYEYPLLPGVEAAEGLPSLEEMETAEIDYGELSEALDATLTLINESGLNRF